MGGKPAGVKSSSGAHAHLLPLARGNLGFARLVPIACHLSVILQLERERASIASGAKIDAAVFDRFCAREALGFGPILALGFRRSHTSAAREAGIRKVMISCAVTGSADTPGRNPAVPVTPEQIAQSAIDAAKAGAANVHIHPREPKTTPARPDPSPYKEVVDRIRGSGSDVLINLTTGPGARFVPGDDDPQKPGPGTTIKPPAERVRHVVALKPDICSLDMGSMNMGPHVFINTPSHLEAMAAAIGDAGVLPELEVFETGHLLLAKRLIESGHIKAPGMFQICLGIAWAQPATPEAMSYMRSLLPTGLPWFAFGISLHQFPMAAQA